MTRTRMALLSTILAALATTFPGCDPGPPKFDKATEYTAESLSQELIFRFGTLKSGARKSSGQAPKKATDAGLEKVATKAKEATKAKPAATVDDLLDDVAARTRLVSGKSRAEVLAAVADVVSKDATLSAEDKRTLADGLAARSK